MDLTNIEKQRQDLYLKKSDLLKLKYIGKGKDGYVYKYNNNLLIKIYHNETINNLNKSEMDPDGVKIYTPGNYRYFKTESSNIQYYDKENVKCGAIDALNKAISKQKDINYSTLPVGLLYVDDKFKGSVLKYFKYMCEYHKLIRLYNIKKRAQITNDTLTKLDELIKNNIYPIDIVNKGIGESATPISHSNILLSPFGHSEIIDLDGTSTIYKEEFDKSTYINCIENINIFFLETMFNYDLPTDISAEDLDYLEYSLNQEAISSSDKELLLSLNASIDELKSITRKY